MKLLKATVILRACGVDQVNLETDLPTPFTYSGDLAQPLTLKFEATKGKGLDYVRQHFPKVPVEIIDADTGVKSRG